MQRDPYDEFKTPFRPRHPAEYTASRSTHGIGEKEIRVAAKPSALFDAGFSTPVQTASALKAAAPPAAPAAAAPIAVPNLYAASNPYAAQASASCTPLRSTRHHLGPSAAALGRR